MFTIDFPITPSGYVTGATVVSDNQNMLGSFSMTFNGTGRVTLTQTADFGASAHPENLVLNFTTSAIPEPSTYALIAGAAMMGMAAWRRRRITA